MSAGPRTAASRTRPAARSEASARAIIGLLEQPPPRACPLGAIVLEARSAEVEGGRGPVQPVGAFAREPALALGEQGAHFAQEHGGRRSAVAQTLDSLQPFENPSCLVHEARVVLRSVRVCAALCRLPRGSAAISPIDDERKQAARSRDRDD